MLTFVGLIITRPYWMEPSVHNAFINLSYLIILYCVLRTLTCSRLLLVACAIMMGFIFFAKTLLTQTSSDWIYHGHSACTTFIYLLCIVLVLRDILSHQTTRELVFAALCVYLLIGSTFASIYLHIDLIWPNSFSFSNESPMMLASRGFEALYFSFTTLTTVGFGDIVPLTIRAKSVVMVEEITGVLYLAVLVSWLVGNLKVDKKLAK